MCQTYPSGNQALPALAIRCCSGWAGLEALNASLGRLRDVKWNHRIASRRVGQNFRSNGIRDSKPRLGRMRNNVPCLAALPHVVPSEPLRTDSRTGNLGQPGARRRPWFAQRLELNSQEPSEDIRLLALDFPDDFITGHEPTGSFHWRCHCPLHRSCLPLTPSVLGSRLAAKRSTDSNLFRWDCRIGRSLA